MAAATSSASSSGIAMPLPVKPRAVLMRTHMLVPRLDTSSPSLSSPSSSSSFSLFSGQLPQPQTVSSTSSSLARPQQLNANLRAARSERVGLSALRENVESLTSHHRSFSFGEDDAVAELMEILGCQPPPPAPSSGASTSSSPQQARRTRKSSVPYIFHADPSAAASASALDMSIAAPPRLASTPFRPSSPSSPVSRSKNPLPFNSPFMPRSSSNRSSSPRTAAAAVAGVLPPGAPVRRDSVAELGLLSPSPEPRNVAAMFHRPANNPLQWASGVASDACSTEGGFRARSKSVTDVDGRMRIAFAC
ncbi:hypothetical protein HDU89_008172 [Geranomyces variabilis]|nr:hypothetical protein HDU89_008172 [Geranomyces variabilis]